MNRRAAIAPQASSLASHKKPAASITSTTPEAISARPPRLPVVLVALVTKNEICGLLDAVVGVDGESLLQAGVKATVLDITAIARSRWARRMRDLPYVWLR